MSMRPIITAFTVGLWSTVVGHSAWQKAHQPVPAPRPPMVQVQLKKQIGAQAAQIQAQQARNAALCQQLTLHKIKTDPAVCK